MEEQTNKKNSKVVVYVIIAIVVVAALIVGGFFLLKGQGDKIKQETITAENFETVVNKLETSMQAEDDLYYFTYAVTYHIMEDAMKAAAEGKTDESEMYVNIYGRTVQELMDDGKRIAEENNLTIDQVKQQIDQLSNSAY